VPVWETKPESDACYERCSTLLLENNDAIGAAFASHNVRSLAHVLAQAQRLGLDPRQIEFQVLYGMADAIRTSLLGLGQRVRAYCPVGELLPGMGYLVRRLLENTSNEGFLAQKFAKGAARDALLRNPDEIIAEGKSARLVPEPPKTVGLDGFHNEAPVDFTVAAEREKLRAELKNWRAKFGRKYPLVINNRPVETKDWLPSLNPANQNEIVGHAALASTADADAALAAARAAQPKWARVPAEERATLLHKLADLMRRDKASLSALMVLEAGKNWAEADADVAEAIDFCDFYAAEIRVLGKPAKLQIMAGETNVQHWWPRGVGVVISPWNFPLAILCGMAGAAVVGGNTVLLKPSNNTPVIAAELVRLCIEAGFPPGVFNLVTGRGSEVGERLIASPQVDFIAFTGSMEVGLHIWETAGRTPPGQPNLKKVICEMGGKNCLIVDSDADLDEAVLGILHSAFGFLGQKVQRPLAPRSCSQDNYDKLVERVIAACSSLRVGPAEEPGALIGPVIDRPAQQRILAVIEKGQDRGAPRLAGQSPRRRQRLLGAPDHLHRRARHQQPVPRRNLRPRPEHHQGEDLRGSPRAGQRLRVRADRRALLTQPGEHRAGEGGVGVRESLHQPRHHRCSRGPAAVWRLQDERRRHQSRRPRIPPAPPCPARHHGELPAKRLCAGGGVGPALRAGRGVGRGLRRGQQLVP
jgi:RHH-type proline utilization regulon transcriptional repressor/proline dehydrogenase/delta 1-pyrroline-5-carboxylate dehydrogenase